MKQDELKQAAAKAAISYIKDDMVVGIGTGTTANFFIEELAKLKSRIETTVASSKASEEKLKKLGIPVTSLNNVGQVHIYVDGTDEVNQYLQCIKGGGGALTGEKIIASMAEKFICIADDRKKVSLLGTFPIAVEVIPMARSYVARQIVKLGGDPVYREGFVSDYGNVILDIHNMELLDPPKMEEVLNNIPGVVCNGIFAKRSADLLLLAGESGVEKIT